MISFLYYIAMQSIPREMKYLTVDLGNIFFFVSQYILVHTKGLTVSISSFSCNLFRILIKKLIFFTLNIYYCFFLNLCLMSKIKNLLFFLVYLMLHSTFTDTNSELKIVYLTTSNYVLQKSIIYIFSLKIISHKFDLKTYF